MEPIKFHVDCVNATGDGCEPLPILPTNEAGTEVLSYTTCWKLGWRDWLNVLFGRKVYVTIMGRTIRPMYLKSKWSEFKP